jgi:hypothetical protein
MRGLKRRRHALLTEGYVAPIVDFDDNLIARMDVHG